LVAVTRILVGGGERIRRARLRITNDSEGNEALEVTDPLA
jgi:hypothetical protein